MHWPLSKRHNNALSHHQKKVSHYLLRCERRRTVHQTSAKYIRVLRRAEQKKNQKFSRCCVLIGTSSRAKNGQHSN